MYLQLEDPLTTKKIESITNDINGDINAEIAEGISEGLAENFAENISEISFLDSLSQKNTEQNSEPNLELSSSYVEVSHFNFFPSSALTKTWPSLDAEPFPSSEMGSREENSVLADHEELRLSMSSVSMTPSLCDDLLVREIKNIPQRMFFKIGDVADLLGVKPFVLRYWETEFELLKPKKAQNKQRMYTLKQVELAFLVRKLLHRDRYSIEGARNALRAARQSLKQRIEEASVENLSVSAQSGSKVRAELESVSSTPVISQNSSSEINFADQKLLVESLNLLRSRVQVLRKMTQDFRQYVSHF
jgi:DNA-binding transcriptional MerR regulator